MNNSNLAIKYIILSIIIFGIIDNLKGDNKILVLYLGLSYFFFINKDYILKNFIHNNISNNSEIFINNEYLNLFFDEIIEFKEFNKSSYNLALKNTQKLISIYNEFFENYNNQLIENAENLKNIILNNLSEILINIPTNKPKSFENYLSLKINKFKKISNNLLRNMEKFNNNQWINNTNNSNSPYYLDNQKPYNYFNKHQLF